MQIQEKFLDTEDLPKIPRNPTAPKSQTISADYHRRLFYFARFARIFRIQTELISFLLLKFQFFAGLANRGTLTHDHQDLHQHAENTNILDNDFGKFYRLVDLPRHIFRR